MRSKTRRRGWLAMLMAGVFAVVLSQAFESKAQETQATAPAAEAPAATGSAKAEPSLDQRVADLEAYINNTARGSDAADSKVASKVPGAGPGH
ncbi:MAG: hypothetical protein IT573_04480, partial [Deltaproteobacteria bacterium]|nr:hypothetical protein [Deltaproteobacteria bacterium]